MSSSTVSDIAAVADRLVKHLRGYESCLIAYSGGVDSAVVAQAAQLALGGRAVAATGVSASLASGEREAAEDLARQIGIRHELISTDEFSRPQYTRNAPDRCYHCKSELYDQLRHLAQRLALQTIANGANTDDTGDYRPGLQAAEEFSVRSPLVECGLNKQAVRELARHWQLPVWDKPASPCLSSRVAYGQQVTPERLEMVDQAERWLHDLGVRECRVRYHEGDLARIEVPRYWLATLCSDQVRPVFEQRFSEIGFRFVTLDLAGFRSGSLNTMLPVETLQASATSGKVAG